MVQLAKRNIVHAEGPLVTCTSIDLQVTKYYRMPILGTVSRSNITFCDFCNVNTIV